MNGEGLVSLGRALGNAANAMAQIEAIESKREAELQDVKNMNQMYRDYLSEIASLEETSSSRLSSTSIKRIAYRKTIDKYKGSGIPISSFQAMAATGSSIDQFSTEVDNYIRTARELGLNVTEKDLNNPQKRNELIKTLDNYQNAQQMLAQEKIDSATAVAAFEDMSNAYSVSLSSTLATVNDTVNNTIMGAVNPTVAVNKIISAFDEMDSKLSDMQSSFTEQQLEEVGNKVLERRMKLQETKDYYVKNFMELLTAQSEKNKAKTEEEIVKTDAYLKFVKAQTDLLTETLKRDMLLDSKVSDALSLAIIYGESGLDIPPDKANEIYSSISSYLKRRDSEEIKHSINYQIQNFSELNYVSQIISTNDLREENIPNMINNTSFVLSDLLKSVDTIGSKTATQSEKEKAAAKFVAISGKMLETGLFSGMVNYFEKAKQKYPNNQDIKTILNLLDKTIGTNRQLTKYIEGTKNKNTDNSENSDTENNKESVGGMDRAKTFLRNLLNLNESE